MGHYIGISPLRFKIGACICALPTLPADGVATGEVNCYTFIVRSRPLPTVFAETISQGYSATTLGSRDWSRLNDSRSAAKLRREDSPVKHALLS